MILSSSAARSIWIWFAARRAGSAMFEISWRARDVFRATTIGSTTSESRDTMMKTTGTMVVHVLSGPTRQMLRRSMGEEGAKAFKDSEQSARQRVEASSRCGLRALCGSVVKTRGHSPPRRREHRGRRAFPAPRALTCYSSVRMLQHDRREFQRLKLAKPILAMMGSANALILDIGMAGAYLEHYGVTEPGKTFELTFRWQGADVSFACEVVRTTVVRQPAGDGKSQLSHTGVH